MKADRPAAPSWRWSEEIVVLEGADRKELVECVRETEAVLRDRPGTRLRDLAYTLARRLEGRGPRLVVVAGSPDDAARKLAHARERLEDPSCRRIREREGIFFFSEPLGRGGKLALLFPGEGSQYPWMLSELCLHFPEVRRVMDLVDRAFVGHPRGYLPSRLIYPRAGGDGSHAGNGSGHGNGNGHGRLFAMDGAVEGVFAANLSIARLLERFRLRPDVIVGHSTGDYAALLASGALVVADDEELVAVVRRLNAVYEALGREEGVPRATLLAVGLGRREVLDEVLAASGGELALAIDNCPHQAVVCGPPAALAAAEEALRAHGAVLERLPFERPYHTARFEPVCGPLREFFATLPLASPSTALWSCATAAPVPADVEALRELAVAQWMEPVRFRETVEALYEDGVRLFVEAGPRGGLSAFVTDSLRGRPHAALPADVQHAPGLRQLLHMLAQLAAHEVALDLEPLFDGRGCREVDFGEAPAPAPPSIRLHSTLPALHFGGEPPVLNGKAHPALEPESPAPTGPAPAGPPPARAPETVEDEVIEELFRVNERVLDSQKRVVFAYLASCRGANEADAADRLGLLAPAPPAALKPIRASSPEPVPQEASEARPAAAPPVPAAPPAAPPLEAPVPAVVAAVPGVEETLLALVAERTGYPPEMLALGANLEADLGIDSIKRVEILGALRQRVGTASRIEDLSALRTLGEIVAAFGPPEPASALKGPPERQAERPLAGRILALEAGRRVVLRRRIDLEEDLWLRDHTLGGAVSVRDPELLALPVVMLTMAVETMAQAASLLVPRAVVTAVRDVRARRFLALHDECLDLEIEAERADGAGPARVRVALREAAPADRNGNGSSPEAPILTASVELAAGYPDPGPAREASLRGARPSRFRPEDLYTQVMFHGPRLQGVESIEAWAEDGAETALRALPTDGLFRSVPEPAFLTDPVLLDAAGQVVGFWTAEHLRSGFVVFPFQIDEIALFAPPAAPGECLRCRAAIEIPGDALVRADFEVTGADGRVHLRVSGWHDKRIAITEEFFRFRFAPGESVLSRPVDRDDPEQGVRISFPDRLMESEGGAWRDGLAHLTLSRRERQEWNALGPSGDHRTAWLLGRVAAKDAMRLHVARSGGAPPRPADVEVEGPPSGALRARAEGIEGTIEVRARPGGGGAEAAVVLGSRGGAPATPPAVSDRPGAPPV